MESAYSELLAAYGELTRANMVTGVDKAKDFAKKTVMCISEIDNRLAALETAVGNHEAGLAAKLQEIASHWGDAGEYRAMAENAISGNGASDASK